MSRSTRTVLLVLISLFLSFPAVTWADPAGELSAAESEVTVAADTIRSAEARLEEAEADEAPVAEKAEAAESEVKEAKASLEDATAETVEQREVAAQQVLSAEKSYNDEQSSHDTTTTVGIVIALLSLLAGVGAFIFSRVRRWPLSKALTQAVAGGLGIVFIGGVVLAVVPSAPEAPAFDEETLELAKAAEGDPADPPSQPMEEAEAALPPLEEAAEPLEAAWKKKYESVEAAKDTLSSAESKLSDAEGNVKTAQRLVSQVESEEQAEASFREEATTIDYDQLIKNPERYRGEKVVYTGQILQIVEEGGLGFMLLSVTDEGYGFWDDNIWVDFYQPIDAAEEDIITVYGKLTGSEEYETQIGGSTFVPRMTAKYIDE